MCMREREGGGGEVVEARRKCMVTRNWDTEMSVERLR